MTPGFAISSFKRKQKEAEEEPLHASGGVQVSASMHPAKFNYGNFLVPEPQSHEPEGADESDLNDRSDNGHDLDANDQIRLSRGEIA